MSDGISRIELKNASAYARYSEEEDLGLLRTAPDMTDGADKPASKAKQAYDDSGLLPVMIENGLEKMGIL